MLEVDYPINWERVAEELRAKVAALEAEVMRWGQHYDAALAHWTQEKAKVEAERNDYKHRLELQVDDCIKAIEAARQAEATADRLRQALQQAEQEMRSGIQSWSGLPYTFVLKCADRLAAVLAGT